MKNWEELELIQRALWAGVEDQSLWFYHQYLMESFAMKNAAISIAPDLTVNERLEYLTREIDEIKEMLELADDTKWIYQSLIDISFLIKDLVGQLPSSISSVDVREWVDRLMEIDPLRKGRWMELSHKVHEEPVIRNTCGQSI